MNQIELTQAEMAEVRISLGYRIDSLNDRLASWPSKENAEWKASAESALKKLTSEKLTSAKAFIIKEAQ